jgi:thiamine biosynthesis lipoprotein
METKVYRAAGSVALMMSLACGCTAAEPESLVAVTGGQRLMGTSWKIKAFAADPASGEAAIAAALAEVERLDMVLSDYDPDSELFGLSAAAPTPQPVRVSDDLWQVLVAAEKFREASDGAFDITVGPLTTLWRQSRRSGKLPRADKLAAARARVGRGSLKLDEAETSVRLTRPGMRLDAGGIGMGYAADQAMKILEARGIASAMIDCSGDILVSGPPPDADGWRILVAPLRPGGEGEVIVLTHAAVTTSGDAFQAVEIDGVRYSHIVDPRTGMGVPGPAAVTVVAPNATLADALATAASVLGSKDGSAMIAKYPGSSARFMWREGSDVRVAVTPGWPGNDTTKPADSP